MAGGGPKHNRAHKASKGHDLTNWLPIAVSTVAAAGSATSATFAVLVFKRQRKTAVRDKFIDVVGELIDGLLTFVDISRTHSTDSDFMKDSRRQTSAEFRVVMRSIEKLRVLESALDLGPEDEMSWLLQNANNLAANVHQTDMHPGLHVISDYSSDLTAELRPNGVSDEGWTTLSHSMFYSLGVIDMSDSPAGSKVYTLPYEMSLRIRTAQLYELLGFDYHRGEAAARVIEHFVSNYLVPWSSYVVSKRLR